MKPQTSMTLQTLPVDNRMSDEQATAAVGAAHAAWLDWRHSPMEQRNALLTSLASILREERSAYADLITREMGKPITQARAEVDKCAWVCEYYAEHGEEFLTDELIETEASKSLVSYQPLGVILAIMPWNFPLWQFFRFAAPTLMAGNGVLLKHAEEVPGCALALEALMREAGCPENLMRTLWIDTDQTGALIGHDHIRATTLTGSVGAGQAVAQRAGAHLKKTVLELGGSDPYIVLADADIDNAAEACVTARMINNGQSCIAAKRFIVEEAVADTFTARVTELLQAYEMGDPQAEETKLGPLVSVAHRNALHEQVMRSIEQGATCLLGGAIPQSSTHAYYPATLLTGVTKDMPAYEDELFGPVASIIQAADEDEALHIANDTSFGLGGAIFSQDVEKAERLAREYMQAGFVAINDYVRSDPRLPFGGIKDSGYGRELAHLGIREFVNAKTLVLA